MKWKYKFPLSISVTLGLSIHFILTETLQTKFRIEIWTFSFQICFRNQFLTLGGGQIEITQIRVFA